MAGASETVSIDAQRSNRTAARDLSVAILCEGTRERRRRTHPHGRYTVAQTEARAQPWTHHEAVVNGVRLHYVEAGSGPLVILLHGFPEFWYSWRFQIPALA